MSADAPNHTPTKKLR
ncbi:MAG: hypothetical protein QG554_1142, partial [Pseudomonadota bacterium]|nr:hypothetical protein [Pseudomonadota bacterium]